MSTTPTSEHTLRLTVDDVGFLLDRLGEDCHPLQFLRELTQNSIEAILRTPEKSGQITWDVDWTSYELGDDPVYKLSITDTGCGMSGEEMVRYINQLSSSSALKSTDGNYGVGAKVAAATRNHAGLIYLSWKDGRGAMIHLWRDPKTGQYGLRQMERPDGSYGHWAEIEDDVKPDLISTHGTKIVLLGHEQGQDTMKAPPEAASPSLWIAKNLNSRYFRIPDGITIKARQGWEQPRSNSDVNVLRTVTGQRSYLEQHKQAASAVNIQGATVRWWILKDEKALGNNSGWMESSGHIAALHKDELYELASGRAGHAKLQQFGIIFGYRQVVLYVEPKPRGHLTTNTARTELLLDSQPLPWADWAAEFREKMPEEIEAHMHEIASKSKEGDHSKSIRERLKAMLDLFKVSRYRPLKGGRLEIGDPTPKAGGSGVRAAGRGGGADGSGTSRPKGEGPVGDVYSAFLKDGGVEGEDAKPDVFPKVKWISVEDGTREMGDIEDKAARFIEDQHLLLVNADFRVFRDMIRHWVDLYSEHGKFPGLEDVVRDSVHGWYEQALVETVIGLQALRGSREWSQQDLQNAWSEAALTSVVMQRYHPYNSIKREMGTKVASLKGELGHEPRRQARTLRPVEDRAQQS